MRPFQSSPRRRSPFVVIKGMRIAAAQLMIIEKKICDHPKLMKVVDTLEKN